MILDSLSFALLPSLHYWKLQITGVGQLLEMEYATIQSIEGLEIMYKKNEGEWKWLIPLSFSNCPPALTAGMDK